jgi:hypothetical protein
MKQHMRRGIILILTLTGCSKEPLPGEDKIEQRRGVIIEHVIRDVDGRVNKPTVTRGKRRKQRRERIKQQRRVVNQRCVI